MEGQVMAIQLVSTAHIARKNGVKAVVYGPSGSGKTVLLGTAPSPVIISAEKGLLSLANKHVAAIEVSNFAGMVEAYQWVTRSREANQFLTVGLDSATEIAEVVLADLKSRTKDPRKAYGELQDTALSMFRDFRDLPGKNVVFTAKQNINKDGATGMNLYGPMMPGQVLPQQLPYFFDEVFQLVVGKDDKQQEFRALRTKRDQQNEAKDRSGRLAEWEPADLTHVFGKILAQGN